MKDKAENVENYCLESLETCKDHVIQLSSVMAKSLNNEVFRKTCVSFCRTRLDKWRVEWRVLFESSRDQRLKSWLPNLEGDVFNHPPHPPAIWAPTRACICSVWAQKHSSCQIAEPTSLQCNFANATNAPFEVGSGWYGSWILAAECSSSFSKSCWCVPWRLWQLKLSIFLRHIQFRFLLQRHFISRCQVMQCLIPSLASKRQKISKQHILQIFPSTL